MLLKKCALLGSVLAILTSPILASAEPSLEIYNNTKQPSSLSVNPEEYCVKNVVTPAGGHSSTSLKDVRKFCGFRTVGLCNVDLFASKDCTGQKEGGISINLATLEVTVLTTVGPYTINAVGSTVYIGTAP